MPGKSPLAGAGWDILFGVGCLVVAVSVSELWQQVLLVILGGSAVVYGLKTARGTHTD